MTDIPLYIRAAKLADLPHIMLIVARARTLMVQSGNAHQWINGYPQEEVVREDILQARSFVCEDADGNIEATFCYFMGDEPTYSYIEGAWLNNEPYGVLHRLASAGKCKGVAYLCIEWCLQQCGNLRVDTHADNAVMHHVLQKMGFERCGTIYVANGTPRTAYQKIFKP